MKINNFRRCRSYAALLSQNGFLKPYSHEKTFLPYPLYRSIQNQNASFSFVPPQQHKQNESLSVANVSDAQLYVNTLCSSMDEHILKVANPDELLQLIVTHRGTLFLQNLVTLVRMLATSIEENPFPSNPISVYSASSMIINDINFDPGGYDDGDTRADWEMKDLSMNNAVLPYKKTTEEYYADFKQITTQQSALIHTMTKEDLRTKHHGRPHREWVVRDERYHLLLEDIYANRNYLDFQSLAYVLISLKTLGHNYNALFDAFIQPLLQQSISLFEPVESALFQAPSSHKGLAEGTHPTPIHCTHATPMCQLDLLIECTKSYLWAGYRHIAFYDHCANLIVQELRKLPLRYATSTPSPQAAATAYLGLQDAPALPISSLYSESIAYNIRDCGTHDARVSFREPLPNSPLTPSRMLQFITLFGCLQTHHHAFFEMAQLYIDMYLAASMRGNEPFYVFTPAQLAQSVQAFTAHSLCTVSVSRICSSIAQILNQYNAYFSCKEIATCLCGFRRVSLRFEGVILTACDRIVPPVVLASNVRQEWDELNILELCSLLEACCYFGEIKNARHNKYVLEAQHYSSQDTLVIDRQQPFDPTLPVHSFASAVLLYLEDHIDSINESAALQIVFSISMLGCAAQHAYLLSFAYRKMASGCTWESHKYTLFQLWLCQMLQYPWLPHNLPRHCLNEGLRAWCLRRGGFGAPFPEEIDEISDYLTDLGIPNNKRVQINGPYELDILVDHTDMARTVLLVVSEFANNSIDPCGNVLLQIQHLKQFGYKAYTIRRKYWKALQDRAQKLQYLTDFLDFVKSWRN